MSLAQLRISMNSLKTAVRITCFSLWSLQLSQPPPTEKCHNYQEMLSHVFRSALWNVSLLSCETRKKFSWYIRKFRFQAGSCSDSTSSHSCRSFSFFLLLVLSHNQLLCWHTHPLCDSSHLSFSSFILRNPQLSLPFESSSSHSSWPECGLRARLCTCECVCLPVCVLQKQSH